jgi:hypothetical protein
MLPSQSINGSLGFIFLQKDSGEADWFDGQQERLFIH